MTNPDAPTALANNLSVSKATQIGITWSEGARNGGTAVIDYTITYDQGTGVNVVLVERVTTLFYTNTGLTPGKTYVYKVQARNSFGLSAFSTTVAILAADVPYPVEAPTTIIQGSNVVVGWVAPFANGSPITRYTITLRQSDGVTYSTDASCNGADPAIMA